MKKVCFKCGGDPQPLSNFYKHARMADGHINKCKKCTKNDVKQRYYKDFDKVQQYEKEREKDPQRKQKKLHYQRKHRSIHTDKYKARNALNNAIRDGRLEKQPCEICGSLDSQAHHTDYSKPLDVHWYCFEHHREEHEQLDNNPNRQKEE